MCKNWKSIFFWWDNSFDGLEYLQWPSIVTSIVLKKSRWSCSSEIFELTQYGIVTSSIQIFLDRFLDIMYLVREMRDSGVSRSDPSYSDLSLFSGFSFVYLFLICLSLSLMCFFFFLFRLTDWLTFWVTYWLLDFLSDSLSIWLIVCHTLRLFLIIGREAYDEFFHESSLSWLIRWSIRAD